ncbi:MAG: toll-Interleukin receptor [Candidatus Schekmanbacteria bacterium RBG_16_38_10]|uniref:Toll-Interleukin receptor n=1 Tax=Candidatus Schekmanbacteria bacterium RBG_16_38_10 TaxID=1817879 RepID=A0A1F7RXX1_9BACT|nr:MAG: toll-Interleukin receptor [Candidatus Schekmanbacteria bacterium RBG_16_38_10]
MNKNEKLKLVISYSHPDKDHIEKFTKHITPLSDLIDIWYDGKIIPGQDFQDNIDKNFENADIVCLFISADFLSSNSCLDERKSVIELKKKKGIAVIPVILSRCGWLDDKEISTLKALPTDGKPISDFTDSNEAWNTVYHGVKEVIEKEIKIKQLKITEQFSSFLQNIDLLTKAHSQKEEVLLNDIFIYPELEQYNDLREYDKKNSSKKLIEDICDYPKILIAGEDQSGKTTLCKKIFIELREKNFVPVYISYKTNQYHQGKIENIISRAFKEQYTTIPIEEIDKQRIIPIIDNFHFVENKEKHILDLSSYGHQIVVVDDIFCLNFKDESIIKSFTHFRIKEFIPSFRNQLIKKWIHLTDKKNEVSHNENEIYQNIDNTTELVNTALGKIIGSGIMPSYPFFILSVISIYETFEKPLDQEITSQGYCYQALIYMYLRKQGVKNDEIDTYINFLTEFAFFFYSAKKSELSIDEFNPFMKSYLNKYNFPIKQETLLKNLHQTQIIALDDCNNYSFCYQYLYYYFVAKYLAEHVEDNKQIINSIINNLHKEENAYIAVFMSHHSKNAYILDEIILNACSLFDKYKPATLSKEELSFFDEQADIIVKAVLPSKNVTPEKERANRLKNQDVVEQINRDKKKNIVREEENDDDLAIELRRSIKTVEVMGNIMKNRAGSLEKTRLEFIFKEAMEVHLRILASFFELIKNGKEQQDIIKYLSNRLNKIMEDKTRKPSQEELEKISKTIFWNMNFFVVYGLINKIIHSVGSNKLTELIEKVCDNENTQASFLIKHGVLMWYQKNLQIDNIAERIDKGGFSETGKKVMKHMIVNHCSMHHLGFREKQKIEHKLGISSKMLLIKQTKGNGYE